MAKHEKRVSKIRKNEGPVPPDADEPNWEEKYNALIRQFFDLVMATPRKRMQLLDTIKATLYPPRKKGAPRKYGYESHEDLLADVEALKVTIKKLHPAIKVTDKFIIALLQVGALRKESKPLSRVNSREARQQRKTLKNILSKTRNDAG